jgi:hypothetical protein
LIVSAHDRPAIRHHATVKAMTQNILARLPIR